VEVQIEKLVYGGQGLGRVDGRAVLVPFVLPGERVEVEPVRETPGLLQAKPLSWPLQAESRVSPPCPVFGRCGGCDYQHIPYAQQLQYKRQILLETLSRIGKIKWDGLVEILAGEPWGYRNRTQLRVLKRGGKAELGFLEAGSHRFVAAANCPVNSPALNRVHETLVAMAGDRRFPNFLQEIEIFSNEREVQINARQTERPLAKSFFNWCAERIEGFADWIDYPSGDDVFRVGPRSFFQVNRFLVDSLAKCALSDASGEVCLDLYAGVGLFTLPLARRFKRVVAVDASRQAVRDLQFNAERAGIAEASVNLDIVNSDVAAFLAEFDDIPDFVVADPPRAGLGPKVTAELLRLKSPRLRVVSCDPATLARDLAALTAGGYRIDAVTLVDLFPQTFHLETVVALSL
jgi:23S rRNA (uracil1939-C5)-methyltransferase